MGKINRYAGIFHERDLQKVTSRSMFSIKIKTFKTSFSKTISNATSVKTSHRD
jgi:hypothetical protein